MGVWLQEHPDGVLGSLADGVIPEGAGTEWVYCTGLIKLTNSPAGQQWVKCLITFVLRPTKQRDIINVRPSVLYMEGFN